MCISLASRREKSQYGGANVAKRHRILKEVVGGATASGRAVAKDGCCLFHLLLLITLFRLAVPPNETLVGYPLAVAGLAAAGLGRLGVDTANDGGLWPGGPWAGLRITVVHLAAVAFLGGVVLLSACLCAQYGHRYRKYQLTAGKEDQETLSLTDNEGKSEGRHRFSVHSPRTS